MYLGAQLPYSDEHLAFARQMGVTHVDVTPMEHLGLEKGYWQLDALMRVREAVEAHGLILAAIHLPLTSAGIEHQIWPQIMLGGPERDRQIEQVHLCIEAAARAGVTTLLYNLAILPVVRNADRAPGRGGVTYSRFCYDELCNDPPLRYAPVTADDAWERIAYFVEQVIPVAESNGIRMGCHQHDPGYWLSRHPARTREHRGRQALCGAERQPVPRAELLPGHHQRDVYGSRAGL
jgi:mannonate dehydratase